MKIIMICGSPRKEHSTSYYLLQSVRNNIDQDNEIVIIPMEEYQDYNRITYEMMNGDVMVIAFPLYVDGIPGSLLSALQNIEKVMKDQKKDDRSITEENSVTRVYTIINNGFYDAKQNEIAISMLWKWCDKCGFQKGTAMAIGAGGLVRRAPIGRGLSANLARVLAAFIKDIEDRTYRDIIFVEPNLPRSLYKMAAHVTWKASAIKNGVKVRELRKR